MHSCHVHRHLHGQSEFHGTRQVLALRGQQVSEPEFVRHDTDAARRCHRRALPLPAGRFNGTDGVALQLAGQLQAHPVHEGAHVLGEVREVPVQEHGDRQPAGQRHTDGGLEVVPLGRLQLLLDMGSRVDPHLQREKKCGTTLSDK
jgi:hypothetical protein